MWHTIGGFTRHHGWLIYSILLISLFIYASVGANESTNTKDSFFAAFLDVRIL